MLECSDSPLFFFFSKFLGKFGYIGLVLGTLSVAEYMSAVAEVKSWAGGVHCILALDSCRQAAVSSTANALLLGVFSEVKCCRFPGKNRIKLNSLVFIAGAFIRNTQARRLLF